MGWIMKKNPGGEHLRLAAHKTGSRIVLIITGTLPLLIIFCLLDPQVTHDNEGVCFQSIDEYNTLLANNKPRINFIARPLDTLILDSLNNIFPFRYSYETDTSTDPDIIYKLVLEGHFTPDTGTKYWYSTYNHTSAVIQGSAGIMRTTDSVNGGISFSIDTVNDWAYQFDMIRDTFLVHVGFYLERFVKSQYCSQALIGTMSLTVIRDFPHAN
jgi:hypothetical protein